MNTTLHDHTPSALPDLGPDWHYAGTISVDSGQVLLMDAHSERPPGELLDLALLENCPACGEVPLSPSPAHTGFTSTSGIGDGRFPVFVRLAPSPLSGHQTVAELRVVFFEEEG